MDPFANGFSLICPTIKHTTESRPSRIRFIGVQERVTSCSLDSEREREGLLYPYKWVRLPPETLWRRVFPFPCSSSLLVSPFSVPLSGGRENGRISSRGVISCRSRATIPPAVSRPAAVYNVNSFFVRVLSPRGCLVPRTRCFREFVAPFNHGCSRQRTCYILREMKSSLGRLILTFDSSRVDKREEEGF